MHIGNCGLYSIDNLKKTAEFRILIGEKLFWGKGVGTYVLGQILKIAKKNNYKYIWLEVSEKNEAAISLYKKYGFEVVSQNHRQAYGTNQIKMEIKLED